MQGRGGVVPTHRHYVFWRGVAEVYTIWHLLALVPFRSLQASLVEEADGTPSVISYLGSSESATKLVLEVLVVL